MTIAIHDCGSLIAIVAELGVGGGTVVVRESVKEISHFNFLYIHGYSRILTLSLEISPTFVSNLT